MNNDKAQNDDYLKLKVGQNIHTQLDKLHEVANILKLHNEASLALKLMDILVNIQDELMVLAGFEKWYFTFGSGQEHDGCYHVIKAKTFDDARVEMVRKYGDKFAFQYSEQQWITDGVSRAETYHYKEIK